MFSRIRCWWSNLRGDNKTVDAAVKEVKTQESRQDKRRVRVNNHSQYCYYERRGYFKTKKGKRALKITATEAVDIIDCLQRGYTVDMIYKSREWGHKVSKGTVEQWVRQYHKGLMDLALEFICNRCVDGLVVFKEDVLRYPEKMDHYRKTGEWLY